MSWIIIFIISIVAEVISFFNYSDHDDKATWSMYIANCIASFAFYKAFFGLTCSIWWLLPFGIVFSLACIIPGGNTIFNKILLKRGLIATLPKWGLILGIVIDVFFLIAIIAGIIELIKDSKKS